MAHSSSARDISPIFQPQTQANQVLQSHVAPKEWKNPIPKKQYNLVVLGAGSGGLVAAAGAAGLGAKVALIEKEALGGDCLNVGCVPSKSLLASAKKAAAIKEASSYGIDLEQGYHVNFANVMERMRELRAQIAPHDSAKRFSELGIDVFLGEGKFKDNETVTVGGAELKFSKAVLATGARAILLPIPGLDEAGALTNETIFSLTELPKRLAIIGAGPIGCEMAQAFARFGSKVTLFEAECEILPREDQDAANIVRENLHHDGVESICEVKIEKIERSGEERHIHITHREEKKMLHFDHVLVGVGRAPNVEGIGLENAGVEYDKRSGVKVDAMLRTSNSRIYAVGDVAMDYKFTHMAGATARIVIQNALFKGRRKYTDLIVPWCTYTQPEIAHVGLYEDEAKKLHGDALRTFQQDFSKMDRPILEGHTQGFVKVHAVKGRIVGATIVGENAGDLLSEITVAMKAGMKLGALSNVIHPYPTTAEAIQRIGDAYNRTRLTPLLQKLFAKWLAWTR